MIQYIKELVEIFLDAEYFADPINVQSILSIVMCAVSTAMVFVLFSSGMLAKKKKDYADIVNANDNYISFENETETYVSEEDEARVRAAMLRKGEENLPKYRGRDIDRAEKQLETRKNPWGVNE